MRVLVVEDEVVTFISLQSFFVEEKEWEVIHAMNKTCGWKWVNVMSGDIDVIILDGYLAEEHTIELASWYKHNFKGPVIAHSSNEAMQEALMIAGCTHRFDKGGSVIELTELIEEAVEERRAVAA